MNTNGQGIASATQMGITQDRPNQNRRHYHAVPQVREGGFYPSAFEKGMRSERALMCALGEMNIQGVSTLKVKAISEEWQIRKHYCAGKSFSC
jgi:transposase-like protein